MASVGRDVRLLVLAASAGSADAWSYFGLGHAFVANMTGNTVMLGLAVFQDHGDLLHPAISLVLCRRRGDRFASDRESTTRRGLVEGDLMDADAGSSPVAGSWGWLDGDSPPHQFLAQP